MNTINLYIRSLDSLDKTKTNKINFCLNEALTLKPNEAFKISVSSFVCPHSFYQLDTRNGTMKFTEDEDEIIIDLSNEFYGNYNIIQIVALLQSQMNLNTKHFITYQILYNRVSNDITIRYDGVHSVLLDFSVKNSIHEVLGFSPKLHQILNNTITGDGCCNINSDDYIYIRTNLTSNSIDTKSGNSNILQKIKIQGMPGDYIFLDDTITPIMVQQSPLSYFEIILTDEEGEDIELNMAEWSISLTIEKIEKEKNDREKNEEEEDRLKYLEKLFDLFISKLNLSKLNI